MAVGGPGRLGTCCVPIEATDRISIASHFVSFKEHQTFNPSLWNTTLHKPSRYNLYRRACARRTHRFVRHRFPDRTTTSRSLLTPPDTHCCRMAPLILHNVPDEELYIGEDGVQRPYAMIYPQSVLVLHGPQPHRFARVLTTI